MRCRTLFLLLLVSSFPSPSLCFLDFLVESGILDPNNIFGSLLDLFFRRRRLACSLKFLWMQQTTSDRLMFSDKYREDSVMVLSESGDYVGPEDIVEYLGFVYESTSPFVDIGPIPQEQRLRVVGYDSETNQCELHRYVISAYALNPALTEQTTKTSVSYLNALFLDYNEMYLTRINIFYPKVFLNWYFGDQFKNDSVKQFVCQDVLADRCGQPDVAGCRAELETLPAATGDGYVDGNSLGCRVLHAAFAIENPEGHCPHVTLDTTDLDPLGNAKCSVSAGVTPLDLFDAETISDFEGWVADNGIDPLIGYKLLDELP